MTVSRRTLAIASAAGVAALGGLAVLFQAPEHPAAAAEPTATPAPAPAATPGTDPRMAERGIGRADAPLTVIEYFSLTCSHCAAFHRETFPRVKSELIDTGRIRLVFRDFPLDQLALAAAQVARSLPGERYEAFIGTLLGSQDRWAFNRQADPAAEIAKLAAFAGMDQAAVTAALNDRGLQRAILEGRLRAEQEFHVNSTPTFVFGTKVVPGGIPFERFAELVRENTV
ncbi:protein-disulfide isomerase [Humitalea rosea]|uniref:Protein-disulfide isomerase n=1 Tax=Humitalea rosea TaxID=990373 RepID=A0A2W7ISW1_9PROT|nr:thioredoxin domain-containing protein [Humitalea rosea]PZW50339.1 protein-disulfide isomerase [Humitalea rosea]